jgi:hypothetical protein
MSRRGKGFGVTIATSGNASFEGHKIKPASINSFCEAIAGLDGMELVIGLDPDVMIERDNGDFIDAATLGLFHEFGFYNKRHKVFVPGRPFLEEAFGPHIRQYAEIVQKYASKSQRGANFAIKPLTALARQHLKEHLDNYPANGIRANTEATIDKKGDDHPLVDNGLFSEAAAVTIIYGASGEQLRRRYRTAAQAEQRAATSLRRNTE